MMVWRNPCGHPDKPLGIVLPLANEYISKQFLGMTCGPETASGKGFACSHPALEAEVN